MNNYHLAVWIFLFALPKLMGQSLILADGTHLKKIHIRGKTVALQRGKGMPFTKVKNDLFKKFLVRGNQDPKFRMQWAMLNLTENKIVAASKSSQSKRFYGASVTKIYVAGALLTKRNGQITPIDTLMLTKLIAVSSNTAWARMQLELGAGDETKGKKYVQNFTEDLGLQNTTSFRGWLNKVHGNETTAMDLVKFIEAVFRDDFPGSQDLWTIMWSCRTGGRKGLKYLPKNLIVGGKTGTYHGPTIEPMSAKPYIANVHHHLLIFKSRNIAYALAILSDKGKADDIAIMAGGLFRAISD